MPSRHTARTTEGVVRIDPSRPPGGPGPEDRYVVPGLKRGLEILGLFRKDRPVLKLSEMAADLGLSRSTAFRLAYTLERLGFLERNGADKSYRLGIRLLSLGFEYLASLDIVEAGRPVLERLRDRTGLSAHLAVLEGRDIVHLIRVPGFGAMTSNAAVGSRRPAHATPMGRVLLAGLPDDRVAALYRGLTLARVTDQTPTSLAALRSLLAADRTRGYVVSRGFYVPGGASVCAPIRGQDGTVVAAINVAGPEDALMRAGLSNLTEAVLEAAREISQRVGYDAPGGRHRAGPDR